MQRMNKSRTKPGVRVVKRESRLLRCLALLSGLGCFDCLVVTTLATWIG
jgi:hypothetical protein